jgi:hypothetical protein
MPSATRSTEWRLAFNARDTGAVCGLFAPELRYDIRGFPERGFEEVCGQLLGSLVDQSRKYAYDVTIGDHHPATSPRCDWCGRSRWEPRPGSGTPPPSPAYPAARAMAPEDPRCLRGVGGEPLHALRRGFTAGPGIRRRRSRRHSRMPQACGNSAYATRV